MRDDHLVEDGAGDADATGGVPFLPDREVNRCLYASLEPALRAGAPLIVAFLTTVSIPLPR